MVISPVASLLTDAAVDLESAKKVQEITSKRLANASEKATELAQKAEKAEIQFIKYKREAEKKDLQ